MKKTKTKAKDKNQIKKNGALTNLGKIFDKHVKFEFEDKDVDSTMKTMVEEPYVHNIPTLTGGVGYNGVYNFYKNDFVGKMPKDTKIFRVSRTVGKNQVVDELILSFTHDIEIKALIPGIQPTGKYVELPHVVVMKFKGNKIVHEHIYWDQASLLYQIGLLDPVGLPITGVEQSQKLRELSRI
ncbi:MAG: ester cyclase [Candidatus Nitrosocosmicus sp.]|nr:ester cyclase [Candidatus Nitrosocosmicus sp.]MDN5868615.1 ester cyclase [Candidatus Nitrosocosmicus sp.]